MEWCGGPSKYEGVCVCFDHRRRWSCGVASVAPGPALATRLKHYNPQGGYGWAAARGYVKVCLCCWTRSANEFHRVLSSSSRRTSCSPPFSFEEPSIHVPAWPSKEDRLKFFQKDCNQKTRKINTAYWWQADIRTAFQHVSALWYSVMNGFATTTAVLV